jgi:hypothetical protein
MAYAKLTLADLQQSLADRHDSGVLPTSSTILTYWTRLLNRGVAYCADKLRLSKETTLTTSSGTVACPTDFLMINRVFIGDQEYTQISQDDVDQQAGFVYWISGNHTNGFYFNAPEDSTFTVDYVFKPSPLSSNSDVCIIPDPEAVVAYAYSFLRKSETDPIGDADKSLQECDSRLVEMQSSYARNNAFNGFTWQ